MYRDGLFYTALNRFLHFPWVKTVDETATEVYSVTRLLSWRARAWYAVLKIHNFRVSPMEIKKQYKNRFEETFVVSRNVFNRARPDENLTKMESDLRDAITRAEKRNDVIRRNRMLCLSQGHVRASSAWCARCGQFMEEWEEDCDE